LSPQILKFYGHSEVNNRQVMIIEWAERGNLKELYEKHDIPWRRKIQIAKEILLGLLFLRTVNVFHHDVRCENVFVLKGLSVKLGNFGCAREVDSNSRNLSGLATTIIRWMAPELIKKYISQSHYENKRVYTFNCEMFSFGMLLWELCYEKLPYSDWNIKQISDHVLNGKREKILKGKFANPDDREIQLEFIKIIQDAWCHQPELRTTIPALRQRLEELATKYPIPDDAPILLKNEELDLDGKKSEVPMPEINDFPEIEEEVPEEVDEIAIISLKDGIDMHKNKNYKSAWECFRQNAELNDPVAKFWVGYYLLYGQHGEKDPIMARKYFKQAADENNHAESQCRYAVSLLGDLGNMTDEVAKNEIRKEIIRYFELAANNPENRNADAMYYLGDIFVAGKLKVKKDVTRGLNYLKLAANLNNERAITLLKKIEKSNK
ncbi:23277_t:CDS:2, partial [Gigaspora margarita]